MTETFYMTFEWRVKPEKRTRNVRITLSARSLSEAKEEAQEVWSRIHERAASPRYNIEDKDARRLHSERLA